MHRVTFYRHGHQQWVDFGCKADAEVFAAWLYEAGAGVESFIEEVGSVRAH